MSDDRRARSRRALLRLGWRTLALLLAAALLGAQVLVARPASIVETLIRARHLPLLCAIALMAGVVVLEGYRLRTVLGRETIDLRASVALALKSTFFAQITPGLVGGEAYKLVWLRRRGDQVLQSVVLLAALRFAGLAALGLLSVGALPLVVARLDGDPWRSWRSGILALAGGAVLVSAIGWVLSRRGAPAIRRSLRAAGEGLASLGMSGAMRLVTASLLIGLVRGGILYLLLVSLQAPLGLDVAVAATALASLSSVVPLVPGGLGIQEGMLAGVLVAANVPASEAVSVAILNRSIQWIVAAAGGLAVLVSREGPATE